MKLVSIFLHIDASLYSFRLIGAQYATVEYSVLEISGEIVYIAMESIKANPRLIQAVNDWKEIIALAEEAALNNYQSTFSNP